MKKKIIYTFLIVLLLVLGYGINYGLNYASIGSAYAAKIVCSCTFVSGREHQNIRTEDLYAIPFTTTEVDTVNQTVSANIYGVAHTKAIYRKGLGCTLVNEITEEELRQQPNILANADTTVDLSLSAAPAEINQKVIQEAFDVAFHEDNKEHPIRTRGVAVLYKGKLIAERYGKGITAQTPLLGWSMTKSVTNAMMGMLVKDGKLDIKKPAPLTEWQNDNRKNITIDHLMRMSSGLDFNEDYASVSDATNMLFRKKGAGKFALTTKTRTEPDKEWYYSSGTTNILQEIMRRQFTNGADYLTFPHLRLFRKIGMKSAVIEPDASGVYVGSSFMYATTRDWAKFGQLYLQDGIWNGERILPEGWVKYSGTETPNSHGQYAAQFWVEHNEKAFPQDAFMALGFEGQSVTIVPSKQLVIVRLGCTPNENDFDRYAFIEKIVGAVK